MESEFFLMHDFVAKAVCPFKCGLYHAASSRNQGLHPWIVFIETKVDARAPHVLQAYLTGVVDDELLLRAPAFLRCGPSISCMVRNKELLIHRSKEHSSLLECTLGERTHTLELECEPKSEYSEALLPLKLRLLHGEGQRHQTVRWFERNSETQEIVLWKTKQRDGRSVSMEIRVLAPSFILFGRGEWEGLVFLSGRVPFVIKRKKKDVAGTPLVVIALQREKGQRVVQVPNNNNDNPNI